MKRKIADCLAAAVVHRPGWIIAATLLLLALCAGVISTRPRLDSEVLNLLPQQSPSIGALKVLNSEFRQGRELIFVLQGDADSVADFEEYFVTQLRAQPWVQRVFSGSPMEQPEEIAALQSLVPSLLLNLEDDAFAAALTSLRPPALEARVDRLRELLAAGSPRAEAEASVDPLGVVAQAMRPMTSLSGLEKSQVLGSADGTLKLFPVVTNQASQAQADCQALMLEVEKFQENVRQQWTSGRAPAVLVTGRSAYVAQIAGSMNRDVTVTSLLSIATVTGLFFFGFRRLIPPLVTSLILSVSCFFTFTIGCALFENLNVLAIAFCSILVGLGDDFSLLLYNRYLLARVNQEPHEKAVATSIREMGPGIIWVALTTGAGFLVLLFSGSNGFAQLGTLIAVGVVLCALLIIVLLFLFIRPRHAHPEKPDPLQGFFNRFVQLLLHFPGRLALPLLAVGGAVLIFAILPVWPLTFDTSPRSLEPKGIPGAITLRTINEKIPAASEAIAVLVDSPDAESAHRSWRAVEKRLQEMVASGVLKGFPSPAGLMLSPERLRRHRLELLRDLDVEASQAAFTGALEKAGFEREAFRSALTFFDQLKLAAHDSSERLSFEAALPATSAWWFLLDRYLSPRPLLATAFVRTAQPLLTPEAQAGFEAEILKCGVPVKITGWTYAMVGIVPWARQELVVFSVAIGTLILVCLGLAYRHWQPWLVHVVSLGIALGATVCLRKLTGTRINLLNALSFPLVLGVGVDYGMHLLMALKEGERATESLSTVLKPLVISGLTTVAGFGALIFARNPALQGLGTVCALGVASCLVTSVFFSVPLMAVLNRRGKTPAPQTPAEADLVA